MSITSPEIAITVLVILVFILAIFLAFTSVLLFKGSQKNQEAKQIAIKASNGELEIKQLKGNFAEYIAKSGTPDLQKLVELLFEVNQNEKYSIPMHKWPKAINLNHIRCTVAGGDRVQDVYVFHGLENALKAAEGYVAYLKTST